MSMCANYYVIAGFDLTKYKTDRFDDWKWEDENEKYFCNQSKGHIQLFYDPMNYSHLYLGYVIGSGDQYGLRTIKTDIIELENLYLKVENMLNDLKDIGIIDIENANVPYELIVFEECT